MNDVQAWLNGVEDGQEWPDIYKNAPTYLSRAHRIITHINTRNEILRLGQRMNERTPTTEVVRHAVAFERERLGEPRPIKPEAFDRWLEQVKAEAWDEGFADGVNHDLGDWENAPSIINNPYRQDNS